MQIVIVFLRKVQLITVRSHSRHFTKKLTFVMMVTAIAEEKMLRFLYFEGTLLNQFMTLFLFKRDDLSLEKVTSTFNLADDQLKKVNIRIRSYYSFRRLFFEGARPTDHYSISSFGVGFVVVTVLL